MRQVVMREWQRVLPLALVVSAGLHLGAAILVEVPPLGGGGGIQSELRVLLHQRDAADTSSSAARDAAPRSGPAGVERYFVKAEVDVVARPISRTPLVIPEHAYHSRLTGTVRARILIGADGSVDQVVILHARPVSGVFENAAIDALRAMRFQPALISGRAVRSQKVVDVVFDPRSDTPDGR
jgi:TonB family protein